LVFGTVLPGKASIAFPFVGRGEVLRPSPPGAPQGRMRWRLPLAQCRTAESSQAPPHQSRPLADPASPKRGSLVLTQFVNHVPSQDYGGSKPPPYGVRFICLPVGTPLPGRPENVAFGTMSPGEANGMIRRCIHSLSLGLWPIQLPRRGSLGYVLLFLALSYLYSP